MNGEAIKGERELEIFAEFVRLSGNPIHMASVAKRLPPEPDILCTHDEAGLVAFELVELCDPNLAQAFANPSRPGNDYVRTSDPSAWIIQKKLRKSYRTDHPIELLCYTDGRIITPANVILPTIRPRLRSFNHVFRRAWLLSKQQVFVVWNDA